MSGLAQLLSALRAGKELANVETWKHRHAATSALVALLGGLLAIAKFAGWDIPVEPGTVETAAGGVVAVYGLVSVVLTYATSKRVGLPAKPEVEPQDHSPGGG